MSGSASLAAGWQVSVADASSRNLYSLTCAGDHTRLTFALRGNADSPSDGLTVQALRSTRFFERVARAWKQAGSISAQAIDPDRRDHHGRGRDSSGRNPVFRGRWFLAIRRDGDRHRKNGRWFAAGGLSICANWAGRSWQLDCC